MKWEKGCVELQTYQKGLYEITGQINSVVRRAGVEEGLCFLFIQHTSASLIISENYDPTAKLDLETFMEKLVPEDQHWHQHTLEGSDDSPSHMRSMLTQPGLTIPIEHGQLDLGTWQGVYVFEHRSAPHRRRVLVRCLDMSGCAER